MNFFEKIKAAVKGRQKYVYAPTQSGRSAWYPQHGTDAYNYVAVQQALRCIVSEIKKLDLRHVRFAGADSATVDGDIQNVFALPNEHMTMSDFLEKITWNLLLNHNSYILPMWDKGGILTKLIPITPKSVDVLEDEKDNYYFQFTMKSGEKLTVPYGEVIHIKNDYCVDDYIGGDTEGDNWNNGLLRTLQLSEILLDGVAKAMKSSYSLNGIVKCKTMFDDGKIRAELEEFEDRIENSESGFAVVDLGTEFTPLDKKVSLIDTPTLEFVDERVLRHFGVPLCILKGDYTTEQYEAFYQKTLEPIIIAISQAFTKTLFTARERAFGNAVKLYPKELVFLSTAQTLEMVRLLGDSGSLYENEKRVAFGLAPLPELEGVRMMSLNYADATTGKKIGDDQDAKSEEKSGRINLRK